MAKDILPQLNANANACKTLATLFKQPHWVSKFLRVWHCYDACLIITTRWYNYTLLFSCLTKEYFYIPISSTPSLVLDSHAAMLHICERIMVAKIAPHRVGLLVTCGHARQDARSNIPRHHKYVAGTSTVLIGTFRTNICPHILITCGKTVVHSEKEPWDKEKGSDTTVRESGCVGYVGQDSEHCWGQTLCTHWILKVVKILK